MILYTCTSGKSAAKVHPCGKAAKALDDAGYDYEWKQVNGGTLKPWTWAARARDRAEIEQLSGQRAVPILVLDDGEVVTGSGAITRWIEQNPRGSAAAVS